MQSMIQKIRVDPPPKFTGTENFEGFYKRLCNYMSLTDENFGLIMTSLKQRMKSPYTAADDDICGDKLSLDLGTAKGMSRVLYYTLGSLLGDGPWMILNTTPDMNGFEGLRRLMDRYLQSKQMTSILLLVQIVLTRFKENDFETTFAAWENSISKFEDAIGKALYLEIKVGLLIAGA